MMKWMWRNNVGATKFLCRITLHDKGGEQVERECVCLFHFSNWVFFFSNNCYHSVASRWICSHCSIRLFFLLLLHFLRALSMASVWLWQLIRLKFMFASNVWSPTAQKRSIKPFLEVLVPRTNTPYIRNVECIWLETLIETKFAGMEQSANFFKCQWEEKTEKIKLNSMLCSKNTRSRRATHCVVHRETGQPKFQ